MYRIDKTEALERRLKNYPSIYIEAAAASGKSVAVQMLAKMHTEATVHTYHMDEPQVTDKLPDTLEELLSQQEAGANWIVFENLPSNLPEKLEKSMVNLVRKMPENWNVIFISREQPSVRLLDLMWKGQMDIIPQKDLAFTLKDVQKLVKQQGSSLGAKDLYKVTGGWAGCVDVMFRMDKVLQNDKNQENIKNSVESLRSKYEIDAYIRSEILDTLSEQEQQIVNNGMTCPWFNEAICSEIWNLDDMKNTLEGLERKGILNGLPQRGHWSLAPLFNAHHEYEFPWKQKNGADVQAISGDHIQTLAQWYEEQGYLREALWCTKCFGHKQQYFDMLLRHYDTVPFIGISYDEVLEHTENIPELHYLRGMCHLKQGDFESMFAETKAIGKDNPQLYLNLSFSNPQISLEDWLKDVEKLNKKREKNSESKKFRLFDLLGQNHTCLCGARDLTGLFACVKKEENKMAAIWKTAFDEETYQAYCLARLDYYIETDRDKGLSPEDTILLSRITEISYLEQGSTRQWKYALAGLYLMCRLQAIAPNEDIKQKILQLKDALMATGDTSCINNTEAITGLYSQMLGNPQQSSRWLMSVENKTETETTHTEMFCQIKGYIALQQYEKAESLIQKMLSYANKHRLNYLYAEALFQQAIVNWHNDLHGQALKNVIESFLIAGTGRYVSIYTNYGKIGVDIIKSYIEWMQNNTSGGWNTKKKYNYGHVLRMPLEDYIEFVLRKAKRNIPKEKAQKEPRVEERLTMMETIVLQGISRGLTNADICQEQNLKLPTVKTHIYSIFKKLGVSTRVQAMLKAQEMGIIK